VLISDPNLETGKPESGIRPTPCGRTGAKPPLPFEPWAQIDELDPITPGYLSAINLQRKSLRWENAPEVLIILENENRQIRENEVLAKPIAIS
jgi:hypothetical protein